MHQKASRFRIYSMGKLETPKRLRNRVIFSIQKEELKKACVYVWVSLGLIASSLFGFVFAMKHMITSFHKTSFYSYFSLLFSDTDIIFSYRKELLLSLVETVPLLEITLSLVLIIILLSSVRIFVQNVKSKLIFSFIN